MHGSGVPRQLTGEGSVMTALRASIGTLASLGLLEIRMTEKPNVAYLLQYSPDGCKAGCAYCLQSRRLFNIKGGEYLGRIQWPIIDLDVLARSWRSVFSRICFQTVVKPGFTAEALEILKKIKSFEDRLPISVAVTPVSTAFLHELKKLGVDALGVGLDACSREVFERWNKPYSWSTYWRFIEKAVDVFGRGNVYVHLVIGLGESMADAVNTIKKTYNVGARVALFNYVDIYGKSNVDISYYRLIQITRLLVENGLDPEEYIDYDRRVLTGKVPLEMVQACYTSGCPGCNRPFYNEKPSGPVYNIPSENYLRLYMNSLREELARIGVTI